MRATADRDYLVLRHRTNWWLPGSGSGDIRALRCAYCDFEQPMIRRPGDKSGLGRYARARAKMVRHLHERHRPQLAGPPKEDG